jgi:hypothetical protein
MRSHQVPQVRGSSQKDMPSLWLLVNIQRCRMQSLRVEKTMSDEEHYCPSCETRQNCHRKKNGMLECEICGSQFCEDTSTFEEDTDEEEM